MGIQETLSDYEARAHAGDGQFAIAAALLRLAEAQGQMRVDLIHGLRGGDGPLSQIQRSLERLVDAFEKRAQG